MAGNFEVADLNPGIIFWLCFVSDEDFEAGEVGGKSVVVTDIDGFEPAETSVLRHDVLSCCIQNAPAGRVGIASLLAVLRRVKVSCVPVGDIMAFDVLVVKLDPCWLWSVVSKVNVESINRNGGVGRQVLKTHRLEPAISLILLNDVVSRCVQDALASRGTVTQGLACLW